MAEQIKTNRPYPIQLKLRDGRSAVIRVMEPDDLDKIVDFARDLPADDLLFLRTDITDRNVVKAWVDNIKNGHTITLLAEVDGELAAYASVHLDQARWTRRVGEIRIITSSRYRGAGLGRRLVAEVFDLARSLGLKKITAQMTTDQTAGARRLRAPGLSGRSDAVGLGRGPPRPRARSPDNDLRRSRLLRPHRRVNQVLARAYCVTTNILNVPGTGTGRGCAGLMPAGNVRSDVGR